MGAPATEPRPKAATGIQHTATQFNTAIPLLWGRNRLSGILVRSGTRTMSEPLTEPDEWKRGRDWGFGYAPAGGTGTAAFGMGQSGVIEQGNYFCTVIIALCEGPIEHVLNVYRDNERRQVDSDGATAEGVIWPKTQKFDRRSAWPNVVITIGSPNQPVVTSDGFPGLNFVSEYFDEHTVPHYRFFPPPGYRPIWDGTRLASVSFVLDDQYENPALAYPHLAYWLRVAWALGDQPQLPQSSYEVIGPLCEDYPRAASDGYHVGANPARIIQDALTHPRYGVDNLPATFLDQANLDSYRDYCRAAAIVLSPMLETPVEIREFLQNVLDQSNANCVFSENVLWFLPLGDESLSNNWTDGAQVSSWQSEGSGDTVFTWEPSHWIDANKNIVAAFEITEDDLLSTNGALDFTIEDEDDDIFNQVTVSYADRYSWYQDIPVTAEDMGSIEVHGARPADDYAAEYVTEHAVAAKLAELFLLNALTRRPTYRFRLPLAYVELEPLKDLVLLTFSNTLSHYGLAKTPVQITRVEEADDTSLSISARLFVTGRGTAVRYPRQAPLARVPNSTMSAGEPDEILSIEPPGELTFPLFSPELWIAVRAFTPHWWGGYRVYLSEDGELTWKLVDTVTGETPVGELYAAIGDDDTEIILTMPSNLVATFPPANVATALGQQSMCYIAGSSVSSLWPYEIILYSGTEVLTSTTIKLTGVYRGRASTPASAHPQRAKVIPLNRETRANPRVRGLSHIPLQTELIGRTLHFKILPFNLYGQTEFDLDTAVTHAHRVRGRWLFVTPDAVTGLTASPVFRGSTSPHMELAWDAVTNLSPVEYEIRRGAAWNTAERLGFAADTAYRVTADGVYWVAARGKYAVNLNADGAGVRPVYGAPDSIVIKGLSGTLENVLIQLDELPLAFASYDPSILNADPQLFLTVADSTDVNAIFNDVTKAVFGTWTGTGRTELQTPLCANLEPNQYALALTDSYLTPSGAGIAAMLPGTTWSVGLIVAWTPGNVCTVVDWHNGSNVSQLHLNIGSTGYPRITHAGGTLTSSIALPDSAPHMLTYSGADDGAGQTLLTIHLDGVQIASQFITTPTGITNARLFKSISGLTPMIGTVDEFFRLNEVVTTSFARSLLFAKNYAEPGHRASLLANYLRYRTLAAFLRFNEAATAYEADSSPHNRHGNIVGGSIPFGAGLLANEVGGQSRVFDGTTAVYIESAEPPVLTTPGFCIEALVKPLLTASARYICGYSNGSATIHTSLYIESGNRLAGVVRDSLGGTTYVADDSLAPLTDDTVVHAALRVLPTQIELYRDGVLVGSSAYSGLPHMTGVAFRVGMGTTAFGKFKGAIDKIAVLAGVVDVAALYGRAAGAITGTPLENLVVTDQGYLRTVGKDLPGLFTAPTAHIVRSSYLTVFGIAFEYTAVAVNYDSVRQMPAVREVTRVNQLDLSDFMVIVPEINTSLDNGSSWQGWRPAHNRNVFGNAVKMRLRVVSKAEGVDVEIRNFVWSVDLADRQASGTVATDGPTPVAYTFANGAPLTFNANPNLISIIDEPQVGDRLLILSQTTTGCTLAVWNDVLGVGYVARSVTYLAKGH